MGILLKQNRKLFHTNDLALLWGISQQNTLFTTIQRYKKKGVLLPIQKGFYSLVPLAELDPVAVGIAYLHSLAYLSAESILEKEGIITRLVSPITLISNRSLSFELKGTAYLVRQMKDQFLYNQIGILQKNNYYEATLERAVADLLYYNSQYYFDNPKLVDWGKVSRIQKEVGFK